MGKPRQPEPVKLIAALLGSDADLLRRARQLLVRRFGPTDLESAWWRFTDTDYYAAEMGLDLQRWILAFEQPVQPDRLAEIKHETNALESEIAEQALLPDIARPVNIDPGYIDLNKFVLATTKDAAHRVYLGHGIYAEVTLQYRHAGWLAAPWTYPDYAQPTYHAFLSAVRERHRAQRRGPVNPPAAADVAES